MGCRGPSTYNSCSTIKWNNGVSYPIGSGHGCIGCSEAGFWDNGPFYERLSSVPVPGIQSTPDTVGKTLTVLTGVGVGAHLVSHLVQRAGVPLTGTRTPEAPAPEASEKKD